MALWFPKNFDPDEFICKCGCDRCDMDQDFLYLLGDLRKAFSKPMKVTSGFRCPTYNKKVGGSKGSQHMLGKAADISIIDSQTRYLFVKMAYLIGFRGIGCDGAFVHIDTRAGDEVLYLYS